MSFIYIHRKIEAAIKFILLWGPQAYKGTTLLLFGKCFRVRVILVRNNTNNERIGLSLIQIRKPNEKLKSCYLMNVRTQMLFLLCTTINSIFHGYHFIPYEHFRIITIFGHLLHILSFSRTIYVCVFDPFLFQYFLHALSIFMYSQRLC